MKCAFCATGKQGFKRNLSVQEIVDQYRYAQQLLAPEGARVANIVFMGQGEPLLNYENVKEAIKILLAYTDLGSTKITVSTAGVQAVMEKILTDDFPPVRWALSLHSAIEESRKLIMPSHKKGFLDFLVRWAEEYHEKFGTRTHFIGLEYIMLHGVNDDEKHLKALIKLARRMPYVRVNLIPYNSITDVDNPPVVSESQAINFKRTPPEVIEQWHSQLMEAGLTTTVRYSQGQDIAAACGQLRNKVK
jgi:23S rRNA (adenine2503-C2)-methyltransferase